MSLLLTISKRGLHSLIRFDHLPLIYPFRQYIKLSLTEREREGKIFFFVPQGPFMGPCTNSKYPNFSQVEKKKSLSENFLSSFHQFNFYAYMEGHIEFTLSVCMCLCVPELCPGHN